tara:strand:- start:11845 stop:12960 length:1116 start_codon:yes stop_codon:yes gene_type:complete
MAVIDKRVGKKGTTYRARVRVHGYPTQAKTFKRLTDAQAWARRVETQIEDGNFQIVSNKAKKYTLSDVIEKYRNEILPQKALSSQRVENTYLNFWEQEFGKYALSYLSHELISKSLSRLREAGDQREQLADGQKPNRPKSAKTLKHYRSNLEVLLNHAQSWGWLGASNPMQGVSKITKANKARIRFLDDDERTALLSSCKASPNPQLYPIVIFALSTGARKSEILKLTDNDLDLERNIAILRDTKNGETRTAPITDYLRQILDEQLKWRSMFMEDRDVSTEYIFPRLDGQKPIDIRKAWENARRASGVTDFRFHDLRHSAASYLAMNGASQLEIAEVLGHKTLQMVKRYSHLSEDHTRSVVEKMNSKIFES